MNFLAFRILRAQKFAVDTASDLLLFSSGELKFPEFFSINPRLKGLIGCEKDGKYFVNLSVLNELFEGGAPEDFVLKVVVDTLGHEATHMAVSNLFRGTPYIKIFHLLVEKTELTNPEFANTQTQFFYYLFNAFLRRQNKRTRATTKRATIKT